MFSQRDTRGLLFTQVLLAVAPADGLRVEEVMVPVPALSARAPHVSLTFMVAVEQRSDLPVPVQVLLQGQQRARFLPRPTCCVFPAAQGHEALLEGLKAMPPSEWHLKLPKPGKDYFTAGMYIIEGVNASDCCHAPRSCDDCGSYAHDPGDVGYFFCSEQTKLYNVLIAL